LSMCDWDVYRAITYLRATLGPDADVATVWTFFQRTTLPQQSARIESIIAWCSAKQKKCRGSYSAKMKGNGSVDVRDLYHSKPENCVVFHAIEFFLKLSISAFEVAKCLQRAGGEQELMLNSRNNVFRGRNSGIFFF
jgi:hypothetical protein